MSETPEHYILATGGSDTTRLQLLHEAYGPGTESLLKKVGLAEGMRVAEIGCGSGNTTCWLAEQVGPTGSILAIDVSAEQVEQAQKQATRRNLTNIEFHVADAYSPKLPEGTFDIAYCRLVLMHLTRPAAALAAMRDLVRPGGTVVCEEMDLSCWLCDPPAEAMTRFFELNTALGKARSENYSLGLSLHQLFRQAGFETPEVSANFPLAIRGERKHLLDMTFTEFAPELNTEGLATKAETDQIASELQALADDKTTLFGFPLVVQVWARR